MNEDSISDFNSFIGVETLHPLVSVVDFSTIDTAHIMGLYSLGFYFISREILNQDALSRFESILNDYFTKGVQHSEGLPTVKYIAEKLALSPNYMSDMIKRETGHSAIEHIQYSIMERAKVELTTTTKGVAEIAHQLGFEYPQYFSRQFKKRTGMTPNEYRAIN